MKIRYWLDTNEWGQYDSENIKQYKSKSAALKQARKLTMYDVVRVDRSAFGVYYIVWDRTDKVSEKVCMELSTYRDQLDYEIEHNRNMTESKKSQYLQAIMAINEAIDTLNQEIY